jgi:large subunit ribosomal protein L16
MQPRKTKYRKAQKGRSRNRLITTKGTDLAFGSYGLKAQETSWITGAQIESMLKTLQKILPKGAKYWLRIFPHQPVTKKPPEVTLGGGKGDVDHYVCLVHGGKIIVEIDGVAEDEAKTIFKKISYKLPIKTKFVKK